MRTVRLKAGERCHLGAFRTLKQTALPALCIAGCWMLLAASPVEAAEAPLQTRSVDLQDVIVTARRRPEYASDVPISLSAHTGAALEQRRLYQLQDLNQLSPSLKISYFNPRGSYVSIRGIGHSPASDGLEASVGVFMDGVYLGRPGMAVYDLTDIDDVEILRGPQGSLFGKNTSAGAIVITTRPPSFAPEASLEASAGSDAFIQLRGSVSGPLLDDRIAARLSVYDTQRAGGVRNDTTHARYNGSDRQGGRIQFLFQPSTDLRLRLIGDYHTEDDSCCLLVAGSFGAPTSTYLSRVALAGGTAILGGERYATTANAETRVAVRQGGLTANTTYDQGAADVTSVTSYRAWRYRSVFDGDLSSANAYDSAAVPTDYWQFSQEIRVANHSGGKVDWVGGIYYFRQSLHSDLRLAFGRQAANFLGNTATPPPVLVAFNGVTSSTRSALDSESAALFGQATWRLSRRLNLTMGLRGTFEQKSGVVDRVRNAAQSAHHQAVSVDDFDPSGTLALSFAPGPDLHLYASYARGAKAGGVNPTVSASPGDLVVRPERTDSYEIGAKSRLLEGRLRVRGAIFLAKINGYQATYNRLFGAILSNVGEASTRGVELEAHWLPTSQLQLTGSASYNDARYDSYLNAPCAPERSPAPSCDLSGRPLSDAPRWIANLAADYARPIGAGAVLIIGADYGFRSGYYGHLDDSRYSRLGNVGIANAQLGVELTASRIKIQAWAKNIADVRYLESYPLGGATIYGAYFGTIGAGRATGLTVAKRF